MTKKLIITDTAMEVAEPLDLLETGIYPKKVHISFYTGDSDLPSVIEGVSPPPPYPVYTYNPKNDMVTRVQSKNLINGV